MAYLRSRLPADAVQTCGAGNFTVWAHRFAEFTQYGTQVCPRSGSMGYGVAAAVTAKLVHPDKLCINVWGDAAIGFTGTDLETAARERIPILSILLNNHAMAIELPIMPVATENYRATDISGDYALFARSLGCHAERVTEASEIVPALERALAAIDAGQPALVEFITQQETEFSRG